jgi:tRNA threonylcarbamoyl adenosine modification protein (Sua5/YciO/YrdC/YwlC family)
MASELIDCTDDDGRERGLAAATAAVGRGDLVVVPTDTVYGVAADAFAPAAVAVLLAAKGRGRDTPVPVLVASEAMLGGVVDRMPDAGAALAEALWPGGLTLVVRHTTHLAWDLGDTRGTVAVRMPAHPLATTLIKRTGPLAVSSANRTAAPPAVTAAAAREQLADAVAVYLDGGPCEAQPPSTIVDVTGDRPRLLRVGAIGAEQLRAVVADLDDDSIASP